MAGRRKRRAAPRTEEIDDLEDASALFDESPDLAYITVTRDDPDEGYVGRLSPMATERDVLRKWGGGSFTLSPRSASGKYCKGLGQRSIAIAGDPVFQSRAAELKWKRQQGIADEPTGKGQPAERPVSIMDMMILLDKQGEKARAEARETAALREREQETKHARELEMHKLALDLRERQIDADRQRVDREQAAERERQREHNQAMMEILNRPKPGGDKSIDHLMSGIKLAMELRGGEGGESDPLTALMNNIPTIMDSAGKLAAVDTPKPNPRKRAAAADDDDDERVLLDGDVGLRAKRAIVNLRRQGRDPDVILARAFDLLAKQRAKPKGKAGSSTPRATPAAPPKRAPQRTPRPPAAAAARRPPRRPAKMRGTRKPATR